MHGVRSMRGWRNGAMCDGVSVMCDGVGGDV